MGGGMIPDGYELWECYEGDWFVFRDGAMLFDTIGRGFENREWALDAALDHSKRRERLQSA